MMKLMMIKTLMMMMVLMLRMLQVGMKMGQRMKEAKDDE